MSTISAGNFTRTFQPGSIDQLRERAAGNGVRMTADQERALRGADLDRNGVIGNTAAERNAVWRGVDDFDRNGTRWSVNSSTGSGYALARALSPSSTSAAPPAGGAGGTGGASGPGGTGGAGATPRTAPPVAPSVSGPPPPTDPMLRAAQQMDRLRDAINSGRIQPGTPGGDAAGRVIDGLRETPVMIYSFDDPVAASNYNEFVRARGDLIQAGESHGIGSPRR